MKWAAVKKILPDWADAALCSPSGIIELKGFLAQHFGLKIERDGALTRPSPVHAMFKTRSNTSLSEVEAARSIATACARIIARATTVQFSEIPDRPSQLRKIVLQASKNGWVDFEALLKSCWDIGIPVVYLPDLPCLGKKMDGMVTYVSGRPVVILTRKEKPDWALFILAHEIGHIALGHLEHIDGQAILDEKISRESDNDTQEREANAFAVGLLTPTNGVSLKGLLTAPKLASAAVEFGRKHSISPGHVILSAAYGAENRGQKIWSLANSALNYLPPEITSHPVSKLCRDALFSHVDIHEMRNDSIDFLEKLSVL